MYSIFTCIKLSLAFSEQKILILSTHSWPANTSMHATSLPFLHGAEGTQCYRNFYSCISCHIHFFFNLCNQIWHFHRKQLIHYNATCKWRSQERGWLHEVIKLLPRLLFVCASIHLGDFTGLTLLSTQAQIPAYPFTGQHSFIYTAIIVLDLPDSHENLLKADTTSREHYCW